MVFTFWLFSTSSLARSLHVQFSRTLNPNVLSCLKPILCVPIHIVNINVQRRSWLCAYNNMLLQKDILLHVILQEDLKRCDTVSLSKSCRVLETKINLVIWQWSGWLGLCTERRKIWRPKEKVLTELYPPLLDQRKLAWRV